MSHLKLGTAYSFTPLSEATVKSKTPLFALCPDGSVHCDTSLIANSI